MYSRLEVFTAMEINIVVFWVVTTCGDLVGYQRFGGPCCLHLILKTNVGVKLASAAVMAGDTNTVKS
jgi:hypothetical protein